MNLKNEDIYGFEMILPANKIIDYWNKIYGSTIMSTQNLERQNQLLKEARDILLSRLMSGMVDPDEIVGTSVEGMGVNLKVVS